MPAPLTERGALKEYAHTIMEGKTAPMGLLTTKGFKYVLEIGRHDIPREGNLYGWIKPTRPVTPDRIFEVDERIDVSGQVLTPFDTEGCRQAVRRLSQLGLPAIAVVFLHAYVNPIHEQQAAKIIAQEYPEAAISLSSEVLPQFREFERSMATVLNAAVMPHVSRYLSLLRGKLDAQHIGAPLLIMKSNGGVTSAETAARQSIQQRIARPLGLDLNEAAAGIVEILNNNMARAIRTVSIGRGHDPRQFVLVAFGGAGPLHACRLVELLDIPSIVIPPTPGVLSTYGLLSTDLKNDYVQTCYQDGPQFDLPRITAVFSDLAAQALAWVQAEQVPPEAQRLLRSADLRYAHQSFELTCPVPAGPVTQGLLQQLIEAFHREHRRLYSYDLPKAPVELVNLRVTAIGVLPKLKSQVVNTPTTDLKAACTDTRSVYFDQAAGFVETPCYARQRLSPGMMFDGPAIVDQDDATTVIYPHFHARVDPVGNLMLARSASRLPI